MTTICNSALKRMEPEVSQYIDYLRSGKDPVCNDNLLLCDLVERAFADENINIKRALLDKYLGFQKYWPFDLFPWEKFLLSLTCCTFDSDGFPRWDDTFSLLGRGAGKNGFIAYLLMCLTSKAHGIKNYDIQLLANSEDQAKRSFNDFYEILNGNSSIMAHAWDWNKEEIKNRATGSVIKYLTSGRKTKDSYRPGALFFDEVHAYEDDANIRTTISGLGKVAHPRIFRFTTDGYVRGKIIDGLKQKSQEVLSGEREVRGFLPFINRLDEDKEVHDPRNWSKANPSLVYFPSLRREYEREYDEWQNGGEDGAEFMTKRMNRPISRTDDEVVPWDDIAATNQPLDEARGQFASFGVDFTSINDFAAACVLYKVGDFYNAHIHAWLCKNSADIKRIHFPIDAEVAAGRITLVDDANMDPDLIVNWIINTAAENGLQLKIGAVDDYRYSIMRNAFRKRGLEPMKSGKGSVILYRPSDEMKTAPLIITDFTRRCLKVGDQPFFRWCTNNTKRVYDTKGNITFGKIEPKSRKTDGFKAYVAARIAHEQMPAQTPIIEDIVGPLIF